MFTVQEYLPIEGCVLWFVLQNTAVDNQRRAARAERPKGPHDPSLWDRKGDPGLKKTRNYVISASEDETRNIPVHSSRTRMTHIVVSHDQHPSRNNTAYEYSQLTLGLELDPGFKISASM
jgi:hypothetical protein